MELNHKQIEYQYFDDFNELVERLNLLISSQQAGNKNYTKDRVDSGRITGNWNNPLKSTYLDKAK